jgi:hypothetical protein
MIIMLLTALSVGTKTNLEWNAKISFVIIEYDISDRCFIFIADNWNLRVFETFRNRVGNAS